MNYEILPVDILINLWKFMALQLAKRHFQCQLKNHWTPGVEATVSCQSPQKTLGEKKHADSKWFRFKAHKTAKNVGLQTIKIHLKLGLCFFQSRG